METVGYWFQKPVKYFRKSYKYHNSAIISMALSIMFSIAL
jgi:hypothetical protein